MYEEQKNGASMLAGSPNTDNTSRRGSRVISEFRRFWWLHLISFMIGTVPFLTMVILAGVAA
jgi:hypothetical protein